MRSSKRKLIGILFVICLFWSFMKSSDQEFIQIIKTDHLGANDKIIIRIPDSPSTTYSVSLFYSQLSSYAPKLEGDEAWIWSKDKKKLIFSVLSEEKITFKEIYNEVDKSTTKIIVPKKQTLYLVDIELRKITPILELKPDDIYCMHQRFFIDKGKTIFQAKKKYEIDFNRRKIIEKK